MQLRHHRTINADSPGVFSDEDDYAADLTLPDVSEWISFPNNDGYSYVQIWVLPIDASGALIGRGSMTFSYEALERIQRSEVAGFSLSGTIVGDTDSGTGVPLRKIVYRGRSKIAALRLHTFTNVPATTSQLVILWGHE